MKKSVVVKPIVDVDSDVLTIETLMESKDYFTNDVLRDMMEDDAVTLSNRILEDPRLHRHSIDDLFGIFNVPTVIEEVPFSNLPQFDLDNLNGQSLEHNFVMYFAEDGYIERVIINSEEKPSLEVDYLKLSFFFNNWITSMLLENESMIGFTQVFYQYLAFMLYFPNDMRDTIKFPEHIIEPDPEKANELYAEYYVEKYGKLFGVNEHTVLYFFAIENEFWNSGE